MSRPRSGPDPWVRRLPPSFVVVVVVVLPGLANLEWCGGCAIRRTIRPGEIHQKWQPLEEEE